ncbi:MAG: TlpA family protein disulfide reductase [Oscillospiraceae bacterium]|nr:TlpA family protein disulfide reductase [Oscillospiraceae bacterium]
MKKALSCVLMLALFLSLGMFGGWNGRALADTPEDRVGTYTLTEFTIGGEDYGEAIISAGIVFTLELHEDGTGLLVQGEEQLLLTWDENNIYDEDGVSTPYTFENGVLTMEEGDIRMVFTKDAAADVILMEDFSVETIYGETFTFSEALENHELVLINLFATWCGPCRMEFPYLQEALSQRSDQVAVIALSIEPTDTDEVLREFSADLGIQLPMANAEGTDLEDYVTIGIPTTILVDRTGKVAAVEIGALTETEEFLELFDRFTGPDYDPNLCEYSVTTFDLDYNLLPDVTVYFCTDTTCTPIVTDEEGFASFIAPPGRYHVQVIGIPEGYELVDEGDFYTEPYGQNIWLSFRKTGN